MSQKYKMLPRLKAPTSPHPPSKKQMSTELTEIQDIGETYQKLGSCCFDKNPRVQVKKLSFISMQL